MQSYTIKESAAVNGKTTKTSASRVLRLKEAVQTARPGVCTERAIIWTQYHKNRPNRKKSIHIQMAEALRQLLLNKSVQIYPDELIVGNYSSKRVGGSLFPELHGLMMLEDIFKFSKRETNPLQINNDEIKQLLKIVPFWQSRYLALKAYKSPLKKIKLIAGQLRGHFYLINESGGVAHLAPDYEKLLAIGTEGIAAEAAKRQKEVDAKSDEWLYYEATMIIAEGLAQFGERYANLADEMAAKEPLPERKVELENIAQICRRVPRKGASSFYEALQSLFFVQIAINLESLDNGICPGRMDQYLYPFYERDIQAGKLTRAEAKELLSAFSIKTSEIIPIFSERITQFHGGFLSGQVVTVGGVDANGDDAVNELSYIFLEVMDDLQMRQPNYHARLSVTSPQAYRDKINAILSAGGNSPALYNDEIIIETMVQQGYKVEDARNYTGIGCVEPVAQGQSFASTDAALVNVPLCLEMALNEGIRFGAFVRSGAKTVSVANMKSMADVKAAFATQLEFQLRNLIADLQAIEVANRNYHPTPLTSALLDGCLKSGKCSTAGGATYNFSGVQCVGASDVGDALYAIETAVFRDQKLSLPELVDILQGDIPNAPWSAYLRGLNKFGNDDEKVDLWTRYVIETFSDFMSQFENTRGGKYTTGLYSVTAHRFFGKITGAMAHGRKKGQTFSSGIAPGNGADRNGPTALLNSMNRLDFSKTANGINFNLKFDRHTLRGKTGTMALDSLIKTYFRRGGMQAQINVLDPQVLLKARDNPDLYPNLLVRVSGYSAYFNDLTPEMQDEIIRRSSLGFAD
ncbi:MAG: formate acetyltransferase [Chloroflexi bacterium]|nr:formate acetyltransferase [Chloroflexota bacterium]